MSRVAWLLYFVCSTCLGEFAHEVGADTSLGSWEARSATQRSGSSTPRQRSNSSKFKRHRTWFRCTMSSMTSRVLSRVSKTAKSPRLLSSLADQVNGAMLMLSAPLALRNGVTSVTALRNVLLGGWISAFGAAIVIVESRLPFIQRWLRRDMRVLTTDTGRLMLLLCAATMAMASGPAGLVPAGVTFGNAFFGARLRRKSPRVRRSKPASPERLVAPEGTGGSATSGRPNDEHHADETARAVHDTSVQEPVTA
ncbi:hypothetical protein AB1Y20_003800 [Prymnesium parvum]|uniref:Solute carrier family 40 protein n=1 Tax=Prymnesium parvum TaxID=97485 RepID=A0AB34J7W5_PRYPA